MAAMFLSKGAIFTLSKSSPHSAALPLRSKFSRVCFPAASKFSEGASVGDNDRTRDYTSEAAAERRDMKEVMEKTERVKDEAAAKANETNKDRAVGTVNEMTEEAKQRAHEMKEKSKDTAERVTDRTKEYAHDAKEKTKEAADRAAGKTKEYGEEAKGAAQNLGEKAKETVEGAWGAAKQTGQKIKETVVGKSSDAEDYVEDHVKKPMDRDRADHHRGNL